jgi:hypothetical protein
MPEDRFGESVAARYDDSAHEMFDAVILERTVAILANLARGGSALELGIGPAGSRCRCTWRVCPCTGSTFPRR